MPRRYRRYRSRRALKSVKYSSETRKCYFSTVDAQPGNSSFTGQVVVPANQNQGMRKVKNFTVNISTIFSSPTAYDDMMTSVHSGDVCPAVTWFLVYVPAGQDVTDPIVYGDTFNSLYEPNQNVIISGVTDIFGNTKTSRTRLSRNLNSGDAVALIVYYPGTTDTFGSASSIKCEAVINYAICYN